MIITCRIIWSEFYLYLICQPYTCTGLCCFRLFSYIKLLSSLLFFMLTWWAFLSAMSITVFLIFPHICISFTFFRARNINKINGSINLTTHSLSSPSLALIRSLEKRAKRVSSRKKNLNSKAWTLSINFCYYYIVVYF